MQISERLIKGILVISMLLSFVMHAGPLQKDISGIHSWRQCQTMWNIHNFTRYDSNILNPRVSHFNKDDNNLYRYEFPFMQWSISMVQRAFGEDIRLVRISMFLIGCIGVWFFFLWMLELGLDKIPSLGASILLLFSSLYYLYIINPIPDVLALSTGMAYLFWIFKYFRTKNNIHLLLSVTALSLSAASKLPFLMLGIVSMLFLIQQIKVRRNKLQSIFKFVFLHGILLLPVFIWYIWVMPGWSGNGVLKGIFDNTISWKETWTILFYHIRVMFPQILMHPYSVLFFGLGGFAMWKFSKVNRPFIFALLGICFLYLILQFNMINTVHDYYMLPFFPALYALIGFGLQYLWNVKSNYLKVVLIISFALSPIFAYKFNQDSWTIAKAYSNPDFMKHRTELRKAVPQDERVILINDRSYFVNTYMVDKMGYVFYNDYLPWNWIEDLISNKGINYMYSDSRKIDDDPEFQKYVKQKIMEKSSVRVFELQMPE